MLFQLQKKKPIEMHSTLPVYISSKYAHVNCELPCLNLICNIQRSRGCWTKTDGFCLFPFSCSWWGCFYHFKEVMHQISSSVLINQPITLPWRSVRPADDKVFKCKKPTECFSQRHISITSIFLNYSFNRDLPPFTQVQNLLFLFFLHSAANGFWVKNADSRRTNLKNS